MNEIDEYDRAADAALKLAKWDGHDPRPAAGIMVALATRLEEAGHSSESISILFGNLAKLGDSASN